MIQWVAEQFWSGYSQLAAQLRLLVPGWPPLRVSDDLALGWDNGDNWATFLPLEFTWRWAQESQEQQERAISNLQSHFWASDSVTFAIVSVAEASDMAQPRVHIEETTQDYGYREKIVTILQTVPFRPWEEGCKW